MTKYIASCLLLMTYLVSCTPKVLETRMIPPPEKTVRNESPRLLNSALANFYGHHSMGKINYEAAEKIFKLLRDSDEKQQGVISYYLGLYKLHGIAGNNVEYESAKYFFRTAAKELELNFDDTDGNSSLVLALMYRDGLGVKKDLNKVLPLLYAAEKKGNNFAPLLMAKFLLENPQLGDYAELAKKKLFTAMQYGYPEAYYLSYRYFPSLDSENYLIKSAEGLYVDAIIEAAENNGNKLAINSANMRAMEMGSAKGYYNVGKSADNDMVKISMLKQAALRGNHEAIIELAHHYESEKLWSKAVVYNSFALRTEFDNVELKISLDRLDQIAGLNFILERIWKNRCCAELDLLDSEIGFYLNSFQNKSPGLRSDYQRYLKHNSRKAFMNCDWYYISRNAMPMELAGDIFRYYREIMEPDNESVEELNNYFFCYAIASGLAGQGELQNAAIDELRNYSNSKKFQLAIDLLKINSNILQGKKEEAMKLVNELKIAENDKVFAVNFINGCAVALLKYREDIAKVLEFEPDSLLAEREIKKQPFYNFKTNKDLVDIMFEEPEL